MGTPCRECGHDNRLNASYCGNCSKPLTAGMACPQCAARNPYPQNYCNSCGSPLAPGERRSAVSIIRTFTGPAPKSAAKTPGRRPEGDTTPGAPVIAGQHSHSAATIFAIASIAAILAVTRLWGLGTTPAELSVGEAGFLHVARQIEFEGWIGLSHGVLEGALAGYAYVLSIWTSLLGDDLGRVRLLSGLVSMAGVGVTYLLVSTLFNRRVALFATLLMAAGVWPMTYARMALPTSLLLLIEVTALYLLFRASGESIEESLRKPLLVLSGALVGLSLYLDFAAIVFAAAVFCLWLRFYTAGNISPRVLGERFAAFALAALFVSLPFFAGAAADSSFRDEAKAILVTETPHYTHSDGVMDQLRNVTGNVINTGRALVWSTSADELGRGGGRIVDPLTGLLVLVGLLVCIRRWREDTYGALLVLVIVAVVGVGLTRQEASFARLIIAAPVVFVLAGFAADWLLSWLKGRVPDMGIAAIVAVLSTGIILLNLSTYYAHPAGDEPTLWTGLSSEHSASRDYIAWNAP